MCLIIAAPAGVTINPEHITNAWASNDDGAGVSFVVDSTVHTIKGLMTLEHLEQVIDALGVDVPRLIHLRFATLGSVTAENTHPFPLLCGAVVAHNGPQLHDDFAGDKDRSDSRHFAEDVLAPLPADVLRHLKPVWEGFIESGNKLAFLFPDGEFMLINERLGEWRDGAWLSSPHYVSPTFARKSYTWSDPLVWDSSRAFDDLPPSTYAPDYWSVGALYVEGASGHDTTHVYYEVDEVGMWEFQTADGSPIEDVLLDSWSIGLRMHYSSFSTDEFINMQFVALMDSYGVKLLVESLAA